MDLFESDTEGKYLATKLSKTKPLKISTRDGYWSSNFYLPDITTLSGMKSETYMVEFTSQASSPSTIHYNGNQKVLNKGYTLMLRNVKGVWCDARKNIEQRYMSIHNMCLIVMISF